MNKLLTIVMPAYRSDKLVLLHLKSFHKKYKVIIIENSYNETLKRKIENKYKNVDVFLKKNIGFGRALNFAAKKVKTKYFISINPDATLYINTLKNLIKAANQIDNIGAISPTIIDKKSNKKEIIIETKKVNGPIMLFNSKIFFPSRNKVQVIVLISLLVNSSELITDEITWGFNFAVSGYLHSCVTPNNFLQPQIHKVIL